MVNNRTSLGSQPWCRREAGTQTAPFATSPSCTTAATTPSARPTAVATAWSGAARRQSTGTTATASVPWRVSEAAGWWWLSRQTVRLLVCSSACWSPSRKGDTENNTSVGGQTSSHLCERDVSLSLHHICFRPITVANVGICQLFKLHFIKKKFKNVPIQI